ncbi:HofP DNA utilization family protein [Scandinavium lactucae]|uniref:HofP DNA utilization family protein n=1 Tax=Scandinavium lactucae TaxID=3095028 RepID=A0ABU4QK04_9ENTR|nr:MULTISPECIES: HofP DNA utilization family protein [unclassified Scandinavium]MDX6039566.1 HofP DNA utilization family protein [Scandinavium sp. V105_6]MDX6049028.1 HofP DNA utilization family protein [Scandinavium sp. V105_1]
MTDWRVPMALTLPLLLGMRDPFLPPEDRCAVSQMMLWHYQGMVSLGEQRTGIVRDASGKWRRLIKGQRLDNGWVVSGIQPEQMDMAADADCETSQWRWLKEGTKDDAKDAVGDPAGGGGGPGKRKNGVAGGG